MKSNTEEVTNSSWQSSPSGSSGLPTYSQQIDAFVLKQNIEELHTNLSFKLLTGQLSKMEKLLQRPETGLSYFPQLHSMSSH